MSLRARSPASLCVWVFTGNALTVASAAGEALAAGAADGRGFGFAIGRLEVRPGTPPEVAAPAVCECSSLRMAVSPLPYWVSLLVTREASTSTATWTA